MSHRTSTPPLRTKIGDGRPASEHGQFTSSKSDPETSLAPAAAPPLAGLPAPLCSPHGLTHVGTLNHHDKSSQLNSYEGRGLSVSQHPEAWAKIGRLTGPIWYVGRPGAKFLDYHRLTADQRAAIDDWGVERGYVERRTAFKIVTWDDGEDEEPVDADVSFSTDPADVEWAREQHTDYGVGTRIEETAAVFTTATFPDPTVAAGQSNVEQILSTLWVAECAPTIDGVWWEDRYAPEELLAPRGVIVPARFADWIESAEPYDRDEDDDGED